MENNGNNYVMRKTPESKSREFAKIIIENANQANLNIREFEVACEIAIRYCREALVPTP